MVLQAQRLLLAGLVATGLSACDGSECEPVTPAVEPIGLELFAVDQVGNTEPRTLYRDGERVQLVGGPDRSLEVRATLSAEALETIEQAESAIASGEPLGSFDPSCLAFLDRQSVMLSLGVGHASLSFRYSWGCPLNGLADIDAMLRELVEALPDCSPTTLVSDCNLMAESPQAARDVRRSSTAGVMASSSSG